MARYIPVTPDEAEEEKKGGNIGLPFGLCAKYGIYLPQNATPRDAWNALKDKTGMAPEDFYRDLRKKQDGQKVQTEDEQSHEEWPEKEREFFSLAKQLNVGYKKVTQNVTPMKPDEIVAKISGGDMTDGSCVSVARAYIGNVIGFNVTDFRGGESQKFFAKRGNVKKLLSFNGIDSFSIEGYDDFKLANTALSHVDDELEYLFIVGKHAAIIRRKDYGFEYLELQSPTNNGYRALTKMELKCRFGCQKSHTIYGIKVKSSCHLVPVGNFRNNKGFYEALGYINTEDEKQRKGEGGSVK